MQLQCSAGNLPKIETELQAFELQSAKSCLQSLADAERQCSTCTLPWPGGQLSHIHLYLLPLLYLHLLPLKVQTQLTNTA